MSRKLAEVMKSPETNLSLSNEGTQSFNIGQSSCGQQKAKRILTSCEAFFSANPAFTKESHLGCSQREIGKVRGSADTQGRGIIFQGKEAKVMGSSPDPFPTLTGRSVL